LIKHLRHNEIDKELWNRVVYNAHNSNVCAYSWYLDVVCPGWDALVLDDYSAVMPITCNKKFGINYLYNPFFVQQLGVFSIQEITSTAIKNFIDKIPKLFKFIEINLNSKNDISLLKNNIESNQDFELLLNEPYDNCRHGFNENTKRNVLKSLKNNLSVKNNIDITKIITLFRNDRGANLKDLNNKYYKMLESLIAVCENNAEVLKLGVQYDNGHLLAGAIFLISNGKITFLFSGNSKEGKEKSAMFFLINHVIQKYSNSNLILDFEGSNQHGLANFYKGFGSVNVPYFSLKINRLPLPLKLFKK